MSRIDTKRLGFYELIGQYKIVLFNTKDDGFLLTWSISYKYNFFFLILFQAHNLFLREFLKKND